MIIRIAGILAILLGAGCISINGATTAQSVIDYNPGVGFSTDFETGAGYTNASSVLGLPTQMTPPPFAAAVTPYNPAYGLNNLTSIGQGGSLTVALDAPLQNDPSHPFGFDFIVFGNSGFGITNGVFTEEGITDGSLFGDNVGATRVSVSTDNVTYYQLTPSLTPVVDRLYPTDALGDPTVAVNPIVNGASFAGKNLAGIRQLYNGSAGGAAFDIDWARDAEGQAVNLGSIRYVRVDVLSGVADIDSIVAVPEPRAWALFVTASVAALTFRRRSARSTWF